jgi:hypothetical protein
MKHTSEPPWLDRCQWDCDLGSILSKWLEPIWQVLRLVQASLLNAPPRSVVSEIGMKLEAGLLNPGICHKPGFTFEDGTGSDLRGWVSGE